MLDPVAIKQNIIGSFKSISLTSFSDIHLNNQHPKQILKLKLVFTSTDQDCTHYDQSYAELYFKILLRTDDTLFTS